MFLAYNKNLYITAISSTKIIVPDEYKIKEVSDKELVKVGKRMPAHLLDSKDYQKKNISELRVAMVTNWGDNCGIATYSAYLCAAIKPLVKELKIFSEVNDAEIGDYDVVKCWKRGECLLGLIKEIKSWSPDFVIIQHEYGLFNNAFFFSQLCSALDDIPYVVQTHSVYDSHLDKFCYTQCIKNIAVHTNNQKEVYKKLGSSANIYVVPHGCIEYKDTGELYNINHNPYTILQFGFYGEYKGLPRALEAISILKKNDPKFKKIMFTYLMSDNGRSPIVAQNYYEELMALVVKLDIEENVCVIRKFFSEETICLFLRLNKLSIFPYINNSEGTVFSASGAARVAIANKVPVIVSDSHLFDDFDQILPRPSSAEQLADEIDKVFSSREYRNSIVEKSSKFAFDNSWENSAKGYLNIYNELVQP